MATPSSQQLPTKENNLFKSLVRFYETKAYKKGIKAADQILKKIPDHGETLAMKGLTLSCIDGKKEEAYELVRLGLKKDLRSHVCWHVYGLMYRSDRDYREAIKCYRNALRLDKDNMQILRDLSLLQVQMRDLPGFVETRQQLLTLKPSNRNNWIAFAIAQHLAGTHELAVEVLNAYESTLEGDVMPSERYEHSEMLLYRASILEESGQTKEALEGLDKSKEFILDKIGALELKARLLMQHGDLAQAQAVYYKLLSINPDNYRYHDGLKEVLALSKKTSVEDLAKTYENLASWYPKSSAAKRVPLEFLSAGPAFEAAAEKYILPFLRKGIPSLFSDLSSLCQGSKGMILEALMEKAVVSLKANQTIPFRCVEEGAVETPATIVWVHFFLAQHYDQCGKVDQALKNIDAAIAHTPTIPDMYLCKARILRNAGNFASAWVLADEAREMDLADRYLNSECVKILLQAGEVDRAHEVIALFAKDTEKQASTNLHEMQCMWFENEAGYNMLSREEFGSALVQFTAVLGHFADITEDQFDFHTYCLRKMTLRSYVALLRMEERLHGHPSYCRAAYGVIRSYLGIAAQELMNEDEMKAYNEEERRKRKQKLKETKERQRREAEDREKEDKDRKAAGKTGKNSDKNPVKGVDEDEEDPAIKLATKPEPLLEACKPLELLQLHACGNLETHFLTFEVYLRRNFLLMALRALRRMHTLNARHPATHQCTIRLYLQVEQAEVDESYEAGIVKKVLQVEREKMIPAAQSLGAHNLAFLALHANSLPHVAAVAQMMVLIAPAEKETAASMLTDFLQGADGKSLEGVDKRDLMDVQIMLTVVFKLSNAVATWSKRCGELYPADPRWKLVG